MLDRCSTDVSAYYGTVLIFCRSLGARVERFSIDK